VNLPAANRVQRRILTADGSRKKARWASFRKQSQPIAVVVKSAGVAPAKRTMSASARRKIAAAQKGTVGKDTSAGEESGLVPWGACCGEFAVGFCNWVRRSTLCVVNMLES
jgi:hypothetical protein